MTTFPHSRRLALCSILTVLVVTAAVLGGAAAASSGAKKVRIAYLSFAVANSYDAPMLAAAKQAAKKGGATITVFDAANDPKKQFAQLQTADSSGQYDAILVQPIFGTGLIGEVKKAIKKGIKVVNFDQIMGPNLSTARSQVPGLAGNVVFVPTDLGAKWGKLAVAACAAKKLDPCNIGFLYDIKASALDVAIRKGFDSSTKGHSNMKIVAEGETFFTPAKALAAVQTMIQAHPEINLIVGSDQGIEGAQQVVGKDVALVGYGGGAVGLKQIAAGRWYGTVMQRPATEGRMAVETAIRAVRTGKLSPGVNVLASLPNGGIVTKANVSKFKAEWPG
ncbi:MAG TPA: sugar ABC transporter substrate-binding protein [Gaiellaceae bacterium]|nr:sugar ABC transporter substrate-binding protein [Gaiellaceae bacterium]